MKRLPGNYLVARWGVLFIGLFWVGLIILLTYSGALALKRQRSAAHWKESRATILSAQVGSSTYDGSIQYYPDLIYRYEVEGVPYEGSNIYLTDGIVGYDDTFPKEAQARQIVEQFPVGSEVAVYYAPEHPEDSVLDRAQLFSSTRAFLLLAMLTVFFGLGVGFIYFANFSPGLSLMAVLLAAMAGLALAPSPGHPSELVGQQQSFGRPGTRVGGGNRGLYVIVSPLSQPSKRTRGSLKRYPRSIRIARSANSASGVSLTNR